MILSAVTSGSPLHSAGRCPLVLIMGSFQHGWLPGFCFNVCFAQKIGSWKVSVAHIHVAHRHSSLDVVVVLIGG